MILALAGGLLLGLLVVHLLLADLILLVVHNLPSILVLLLVLYVLGSCVG